MYDKRSHSVEDRIASLSQPHVRPIVRGKVNAPVEFGAKLAISLVDGYARMEKLSWDSFNESLTLRPAVEAHVERYDCYPEAILTNQIYRTERTFDIARSTVFVSAVRVWGVRRKTINLIGTRLDGMHQNETPLKESLEKANAPMVWGVFERAFVRRARQSLSFNCL